MRRLLITGAAGGLGTILRDGLTGWADFLRLNDIAEMPAAGPNEEVVQGDLADFDLVKSLVRDIDGIVHLGGISKENTFENLLDSSFRGTYHVFDAARQAGKPRIVFASSNHAIGFHRREDNLGKNAAYRPDSIYGLSKVYGESLGQYYFDKFGIESVSIRIGSCFAEPADRRMLATWLSPRDFVEMIKAIYSVPRVGCTMMYGMSANKEQWWDNSHAAFIGWHPQDSSEQFRAKVEAADPPKHWDDPAVRYHGGGFAVAGHFED